MLNVGLDMTDDIEAMFDKLEQKVQTQVLFSGAAAAAKVFYEEVQSQASRHVKTGLLYSAIYRKYSPEKSTPGRIVYNISVNKAKAPHWHFLEYGTSRQPAYPYIRPAWARANYAMRVGIKRMGERMQEIES